jgi:hypothetical protein
MTNQEYVLQHNPTAKLNIWDGSSPGKGFWVSGPGLETKVCYSEDRAWELAAFSVSTSLRHQHGMGERVTR